MRNALAHAPAKQRTAVAAMLTALRAPGSINTRDANRDNHLRSNDFFGVEQNPVITFRSTRIEEDGDDYKIHGDLTMNGVTKEVVLEAEFNGMGASPMGSTVYAFSAETKINRKDFNINYDDKVALGPAVGEEVQIRIWTEGVKAEDAQKGPPKK